MLGQFASCKSMTCGEWCCIRESRVMPAKLVSRFAAFHCRNRSGTAQAEARVALRPSGTTWVSLMQLSSKVERPHLLPGR